MYILDNNILNILFYPSPARARVEAKIASLGKSNVWLSVIVVYEKLALGVLPTFKHALNNEKQILGFQTLIEHIEKLSTFQILPFTEKDYENFKLIYEVVKKSPMDCRIAACAKSRPGWTVVTHDRADFDVIRKRCGIDIEDWSETPPK